MPDMQLLKHVVQGALGTTKAYSGLAAVYQEPDGPYKWQYTREPYTARLVCVILNGNLKEISATATPEETEFINLVIQTEGENNNG